VALIKPAELDGFAERHPEVVENAHVYFVCQRPRVRILSADLQRPDELRVVLSIAKEKGTLEREIVIPAAVVPIAIKSVGLSENGAYLTISDAKNSSAHVPPEFLLTNRLESLRRVFPSPGRLRSRRYRRRLSMVQRRAEPELMKREPKSIQKVWQTTTSTALFG
jgi:hypothetical protein